MKTLEDEWYIVIKALVNSICRDSMDTQYMIIQNKIISYNDMLLEARTRVKFTPD